MRLSCPPRLLYFGIEIEERLDAGAQLLLNFLFASFEHVHRDVSSASVFQFHTRLSNLHDFIGGQEPHPIHKYKVCHPAILHSDRTNGADVRNNCEFAPLCAGECGTRFCSSVL